PAKVLANASPNAPSTKLGYRGEKHVPVGMSPPPAPRRRDDPSLRVPPPLMVAHGDRNSARNANAFQSGSFKRWWHDLLRADIGIALNSTFSYLYVPTN